MRFIAAVLSLSVLVGSIGGWAGLHMFNSSISRVTLNLGGRRPPERPGDMNVLLLGSDSRAGTDGEYGSQAEVGGLHSDTTIIAHLDKNGSVTLLSVPRDTLVTAPPGTPNIPRDGRDKLTNVLAGGGVKATIATLESLTGLKIDHFVIIDLAGFKKMTDAVGGVTVCVAPLANGSTANLHDNWSQWHGHLGLNELDGDQALAFVRTRHALGDERLRILRQQQFLAKLLAKATSAGVLTNPVRISQLLRAVGGSLQVDAGLSTTEMIKMAQRLHSLAGGGASFLTLPTHIPTAADGAVDLQGNIPPHGDVLIYDPQQAEQILAPLRPARNDGPATGEASVLEPGQAPVAEVRNDTGRRGQASQAVRALHSLGFGGALAPTTGTRTQAATEVLYGPGNADAARTLAAAVPDARTVASSTATSGLVLVLGTSFTGVAEAAVSATIHPSVTSDAGSPARGLAVASPSVVSPSVVSPSAPPPVAAANTGCTP